MSPAILIACLAGCSVNKDIQVGQAAVTGFHQELDGGDFAGIYAGASADMKTASTEADLTKLLSAVHRKLGTLQSASMTGFNETVNTSGRFLTLKYASAFQQGKADENFVFRIQNDQPLLAGYHINSNALITN